MSSHLSSAARALSRVRVRRSLWAQARLPAAYRLLSRAECELRARAVAAGREVVVGMFSFDRWWIHSSLGAPLMRIEECPTTRALSFAVFPHRITLRLEERRRTSVRLHERELRVLDPGVASLIRALPRLTEEMFEAVCLLPGDLAAVLASPAFLGALPPIPGTYPPASADDAALWDGVVLPRLTAATGLWVETPARVREVACGLAPSWDAGASLAELLAAANECCLS